jgi:hypothetical protein
MSVLFSNNASTTLSAGVGNSATSITVADGSVFPSISGSDYFYVTLEVDSDSDLKEIVKVTARSGNTLTITRGQDGTSARTFSSGDKCELRLTAAGLNDVATQADTDTTYTAGSGLSLTGTEFANTAPDQTVALTGAGTTTISGTYPNFTITGAGTTYTAGTGLTLTGTEFQLTDTNAKLNASDYTAADVLTKIKTVDGSGSGLDADTLDGVEASGFITTSVTQPSNIAIRNGSPTIYLRDTDHNSAMLHCNADIFYVLRGGDDTTTWTQVNGQWPLQINLTNNASTFGGDITAVTGNYSTSASQNTFTTPHGNIQLGPMNTSHAHIYTDRPNFYFNKELRVLGDTVWHAGNDGSGSGLDADTVDGIQASSFLRSDADDTCSGAINFTAGMKLDNHTIFNGSDTWFRSNGTTGWYAATYGGGMYMLDTTWVRVYNGKRLYVPNQIAATGNITAYYSDERLKTKTGGIENALEKVQSLSGFTYVENDLARELGYANEKQQVGVSAQQVQAVIPEAVSLAPVDFETDEHSGEITSKSGENYLTVDYSRIVPLLIEAIKELKAEVDELKGGN